VHLLRNIAANGLNVREKFLRFPKNCATLFVRVAYVRGGESVAAAVPVARIWNAATMTKKKKRKVIFCSAHGV
jgi:hypothetical protein